jgi:hypothetical protein
MQVDWAVDGKGTAAILAEYLLAKNQPRNGTITVILTEFL